MKFREDFLEILRACLAEADDWWSVERCFRERIDEEDEGEVEDARPVVFAFAYLLVSSRKEEPRERVGVFGSKWGLEGNVFPQPLGDVSDEMLDIWREYAEATEDHSLAISRLHDLLWVRRHGDRITHARRAFDGYLALAGSEESMGLVDVALRALEIANEIKDDERLAKAVEKAVAVIESEIADATERRPGIPMNLLEALIGLKTDARPASLEELVEAAGERYGDDPHIAQSVSELKVLLAPAEDKVKLKREQVEQWLSEADKATGMMRHVWLEQALGLARTHGFTDMAEEILVAMQSMSEEDLELKSVTSEIKVSREEVDRYIRSFKDEDSWQNALTRFGGEGPPSGDAESNRDLTRELAEKYPVSRLFSTQILGAHGSTLMRAASEEDHDRIDLSKQEALAIRMWGPLGVEILETIEGEFGTPERDELVAFFTTDLIDGAVADRIADAVLRYLAGDIDGALHVLIPQLEAAIRAAAARVGIPVIKMPAGPQPGGVRALGALLSDFEGRMDESWRRYLLNALADPLGVNLRNHLSHGLYGPAASPDAAIAIQIACQLRLWRLKAPDENNEEGTQ